MSLELKGKVVRQTVTRDAAAPPDEFVVVRHLSNVTVTENVKAAKVRKTGKQPPLAMVPSSAIAELQKERDEAVRGVQALANEVANKLQAKVKQLEKDNDEAVRETRGVLAKANEFGDEMRTKVKQLEEDNDEAGKEVTRLHGEVVRLEGELEKARSKRRHRSRKREEGTSSRHRRGGSPPPPPAPPPWREGRSRASSSSVADLIGR
jgi:chromosome segregation ATPase